MKHLKLLLMIISMLVLADATASSTDFALHQAVLDDDKQLVRKLISKGAAIDVIGSRKYGYGSPLHLAVREGHLDIAKLLLDRGAQVDVLDPDDFTPLHNAAWNGNLEMTELLLDAGADIEASTYEGDTPLSLAQNNDQPKVAEFIQAKLQPSATSKTKVESTPVSDAGVIDISGTYASEITADSQRSPFYLIETKYKNIDVKLIQNGNEITGSFGGSRGLIWGRIEGDTIFFSWEVSAGDGGKGKWTIKPGGNEITGNWFHTFRGSGEWNLTRIQSKVESAPASDSGVIDISGTYISEMTAKGFPAQEKVSTYLGKKPNIEVKIEQDNEKITGLITGSRTGELEGVIKGNTITFNFHWIGVELWSNFYGEGSWIVSDGPVNLKGSWKSITKSRGANGIWNLTKIESDTALIPDVSGIYISEVTGDTHRLGLKNKPYPETKIVQTGNTIEGSLGTWCKIYGKIEGNTISFEWVRPRIGWAYGRGKWAIQPGGNEIVGEWIAIGGKPGTGKWNLTRIE
jgi:hypothetical protein